MATAITSNSGLPDFYTFFIFFGSGTTNNRSYTNDSCCSTSYLIAAFRLSAKNATLVEIISAISTGSKV
ncbi:hypothetical protein SR1949_33070 [Sphaerospermopsis reniformis]|jgi:hypothetical protein|uniref:Uncharacterized protein n=1 Tax=Sphaerospermopsis reniformis TaxID=531300 RepID=A0A480A396_9CYAN|nr:hypothetical protein SR1949_33070 [Sphaerospermopsis reniformis]